MRTPHVFGGIVFFLFLTGLGFFPAGGRESGPCPSSAQAPQGRVKPTFTGEFEFREVLEFQQHGKVEVELKANIPFRIFWHEKVGAWAIKGEVKDAKGTSTSTAPGGARCQGPLKGTIELSGWVTVEKLKACLFKLNLDQTWADYVWTCRVPRVPPYKVECAGFTLNHILDFATEGQLRSQNVEAGIMKGFLYLRLTQFSGTMIDGCGVLR